MIVRRNDETISMTESAARLESRASEAGGASFGAMGHRESLEGWDNPNSWSPNATERLGGLAFQT